MNNRLLLLIVCTLFFVPSCTENFESIQKEINQKIDSTDTIDSTFTQSDSIGDVVSLKEGTAYYNSAYCNGAPPPEEILRELKQYRILENSEIKFVNHSDKKDIIYAKTDDKGKLRINLPSGKWDYYLTPNIDKKYGIDPSCKERFINRSGTILIEEIDKKLPDLHFYFDCDPCDFALRMRP